METSTSKDKKVINTRNPILLGLGSNTSITTCVRPLQFFSDDIDNRMVSRQSTSGSSSRIFYHSGREGMIPFQWEEEPGKPYLTTSLLVDEPPSAESPQVLPLEQPDHHQFQYQYQYDHVSTPLSPPPAGLSLNLSLSNSNPNPCIKSPRDDHHHYHPRQYRFIKRIWKKILWVKLRKENTINSSSHVDVDVDVDAVKDEDTTKSISYSRSRYRSSARAPAPAPDVNSIIDHDLDDGYFWKFDVDTMMVMPRNLPAAGSVSSSTSSRSLSSNSSSSNAASFHATTYPTQTQQHGFTCSPINFRSTLVSLVKRI